MTLPPLYLCNTLLRYGNYCTRSIPKMTIDVIGQRLLTGRLVIAAVQIRYVQRVLDFCRSCAHP